MQVSFPNSSIVGLCALSALLTAAGCRDHALDDAQTPRVAPVSEDPPPAKLQPAPPQPPPATVAPTLAACADGRALHEAIFGPAMRACAESVPSDRVRIDRDEDLESLSEQWTEQERGAASRACASWQAELESLDVPDCADDPPFAELPIDEILMATRASVALRIGALEPEKHVAAANALLSASEALFSLARGYTPGIIVGTATHFATESERWSTLTRSDTAALRSRRRALLDGLPSAGHRWAVIKAEIEDDRGALEDEATSADAFVLRDVPDFTDDTFDTKRVAPEIWEVVIDDLLAARCDADWDACKQSLRAASERYTDSSDAEHLRKLFWASEPMAYADLDGAQRDALDAALCNRAADYLILPFSTEYWEIERLREPRP